MQDPLVPGVCAVLVAMPGATDAGPVVEEYGGNPGLASPSVFIATVPWSADLAA